MKIKVMVALLLLLVMFGLHLSCSQYAVEIEEIVVKRESACIVKDDLIH